MQFLLDDTICSISTPPGTGAIAIVRVSGKDSLKILSAVFYPFKIVNTEQLKPQTACFGQIKDNGQIIDEAIVMYFKAPKSYTGEDLVEISCHGSTYIQQQVMQTLINRGCRTAQPGEFTMRAFLNKKMDLMQAEAVADLIHSRNAISHQMAITQMKGSFSKRIIELSKKLLNLISLVELEIDFSEEDVEFADRATIKNLLDEIFAEVKKLCASYSSGQAIKHGIPVAIAGQPNTGKSTLLNQLLHEERAIVSEIPGTTRDTIEETITFNNIEFRFIDTAGLRHTNDSIETMGIKRSIEKIINAWIVLFMFEPSDDIEKLKETIAEITCKLTDKQKIIPVLNKIDLSASTILSTGIIDIFRQFNISGVDIISISAKYNQNIDVLIEKLDDVAKSMLPDGDSVIVFSTRQYELLLKILKNIEETQKALANKLPCDLLAFELHKVIELTGELSGTDITPDMILGNIFKNFCIGK